MSLLVLYTDINTYKGNIMPKSILRKANKELENVENAISLLKERIAKLQVELSMFEDQERDIKRDIAKLKKP